MPKQLNSDVPPAVTKAEFARRVGLSRARISQLVSHGLPVLPDGRIDLETALRWLDENLDPSRRRLNTLNTLNSVDGAERADASPAEGSFSEARRRHEWAKVQRALLRLDRERGALIDRAKACDTVFKLARQERDSWAGWPARVAALLAAELRVDPHELEIALRRRVSEHLLELSDPKINL